jgi:hypothetical protein
VRRYEKRSTTMAMVTEQRLQNIEVRLQDTLSLAAAAAHHSQERGPASKTFSALTSMIIAPLKIMWSICIWPFYLLEELYVKLKIVVLGSKPRRTEKRGTQRHSSKSGTDDRIKDRPSQRKPSR